MSSLSPAASPRVRCLIHPVSHVGVGHCDPRHLVSTHRPSGQLLFSGSHYLMICKPTDRHTCPSKRQRGLDLDSPGGRPAVWHGSRSRTATVDRTMCSTLCVKSVEIGLLGSQQYRRTPSPLSDSPSCASSGIRPAVVQSPGSLQRAGQQ